MEYLESITILLSLYSDIIILCTYILFCGIRKLYLVQVITQHYHLLVISITYFNDIIITRK